MSICIIFYFILFFTKLDILKELLANRRIPGEVRRIIKEPVIIRTVVNMQEANYDMNVEEVCLIFDF